MKIRELFAPPWSQCLVRVLSPQGPGRRNRPLPRCGAGFDALKPRFFSVTYGAGGGTRDTTLRVVQRIRSEFSVEAMAHLTCVGSTSDMLAEVLDEAISLGIDNILCLRGDPPKGEKTFTPVAGGFANAVDLIRFVKKRADVGIGAACYPEGHIECPSRQLDWDRAAAKVDAGADFLITQLFYDVRPFLEMEDYLRTKRGVKVPIIPGLLPILNTAQIKRFTNLCGATIPAELMARLEHHAAADESVRKLGVEHATEMCRQLIDHGVVGFHFYCLNRVPSVNEVVAQPRSSINQLGQIITVTAISEDQ